LTLINTSSFLTLSVQLIFSILLQHHISKLDLYQNKLERLWTAGIVAKTGTLSCFWREVLGKNTKKLRIFGLWEFEPRPLKKTGILQCPLRAKHFDSLHIRVIWQNQNNSCLAKFIFKRLLNFKTRWKKYYRKR
jgi:hypothetical protein